ASCGRTGKRSVSGNGRRPSHAITSSHPLQESNQRERPYGILLTTENATVAKTAGSVCGDGMYNQPTMLDPAALYRAAQQALRASQNDEARRLCLQLIALKPAFADGYFILAMSEVNAGRLQPAIEALERAMVLKLRAEYLAHYAKCLVLARRDSEALAAADRA